MLVSVIEIFLFFQPCSDLIWQKRPS